MGYASSRRSFQNRFFRANPQVEHESHHFQGYNPNIKSNHSLDARSTCRLNRLTLLVSAHKFLGESSSYLRVLAFHLVRRTAQDEISRHPQSLSARSGTCVTRTSRSMILVR